MIRYARSNAPAVEFIVEDARSLHVPETYHAVVSTYDSLNHVMSIDELFQVFRNVQSCLLPGGVFLFDLNMEDGYRTRWRGSFGIVQDDHVCVVRASFDEGEKIGQTAITVFRLEGVVWLRSDVTLLQRCYSESEIRSGLEAAGLMDIRSFDAQKDWGWSRDAGRVFFLSRKGDGESDGG